LIKPECIEKEELMLEADLFSIVYTK